MTEDAHCVVVVVVIVIAIIIVGVVVTTWCQPNVWVLCDSFAIALKSGIYVMQAGLKSG